MTTPTCLSCGMPCPHCSAQAAPLPVLPAVPEKLDLGAIDWANPNAVVLTGWVVDMVPGWQEKFAKHAAVAGGPACRHMQIEEYFHGQIYKCADCGKQIGLPLDTPFRIINKPLGMRRCYCHSLYGLQSSCPACSATGGWVPE